MSKLRVAVLRGGPGHEYEVSLATGARVLAHLPARYEPRDILIDRRGVWHHRGLPFEPRELANHADVAWNAMHGEFGEDGQVQSLLESAAVPYTGSAVFASAVGMNKAVSKEIFRRAGLKTPMGKLLRKAAGLSTDLNNSPQAVPELAKEVFQTISPPWVVKPADRGSSVGLGLARNFNELTAAIAEGFRYSDQVLVEEYIRGREATVGVIDQFRGREHYALPPTEIRRPGQKGVWTYDDKYSGATQEICPSTFSPEEKRELEQLAVAAHQSLGLRHYSRSDFIVPARHSGGSPRGIYLLEANSLPGLTGESLLPKALAAVGCAYPEFLDHVIKLALKQH